MLGAWMSAHHEPFDVARARRDTPGCAAVVHFNNAGASLAPTPVFDAVVEHLTLEAQMGAYEAQDARRERIEHVYHAAARLLGAAHDEIAIVENATRAWDMAFYALQFRPGDRILVSSTEYVSSVVALLQTAKRNGAVIETIPNDEDAQISIGALRSIIDERVKLIAVTHVPSNGGLIAPSPRSAGSHARPESFTCSTPVNRSGSCPSMCKRSDVTSSPRRGGSSCEGLAAPGCST
ncbi:Cysteine desulfurase [Labilithrix luteola]|uniref:Cysteine desulfurase n=1 Tax=Labilithrix luteola TaxID=1391654 RepID=A0A0K1PUD8_9BACT|nr:Cysteine desulfurase [Labilithrix luteola]